MPARVEPLEARRLFVAISEVGLIDGPAPAPYSFTDPYSADAPPTTHYVGTGHGGTRRHPVEFAVAVKLGDRGDVLLVGGRPLSGTANSATGATGFTITAWDYAGVGANSTTYTLQGKLAGGAASGSLTETVTTQTAGRRVRRHGYAYHRARLRTKNYRFLVDLRLVTDAPPAAPVEAPATP